MSDRDPVACRYCGRWAPEGACDEHEDAQANDPHLSDDAIPDQWEGVRGRAC